jgi:hypothetical protein
VAKGNERPEGLKDDRGVDDAVHVEFAEVFEGRDAALIMLEDVFLKR